MQNKDLKDKRKSGDDLWRVKGKALELSHALKNNQDNAVSKTISFLEQILDEKETSQQVALSWLIKSKAFSKLDPQKVFEVSIKCLKRENTKMLGEILKAVKLQSPLREDLGLFITDGGNTLGHLAAQIDNQRVLNCLHKMNPEYLRVQNENGDTIPHMASKYLSYKSIEVMVKKYPGLFYVRNKQGLRPTDLEGGPLIKTKIKDKDIQQAWNMDNSIYQKSLATLQKACALPTKLKEKKSQKNTTKDVNHL
jgi:hypothetical protein